ncbi:hypothetical protein [Marinicellulosiphila megalodicopiae]|uniref:hypothetical protein n=1 Tax=Marinicellulosiphila megalodicopiae TaxID=2724896 RepID=UPI003BB1FB05
MLKFNQMSFLTLLSICSSLALCDTEQLEQTTEELISEYTADTATIQIILSEQTQQEPDQLSSKQNTYDLTLDNLSEKALIQSNTLKYARPCTTGHVETEQ